MNKLTYQAESSSEEQVSTKMLHQMQILEKKYEQLSMSLQREKITTVPQDRWLADYIRKGSLNADMVTKAETLEFPDPSPCISGDTSMQIISTLQTLSPIRKLCSTERISSNYLDVIQQEKEFECRWEYEQNIGDTASPIIKNIKINLHDLYACPKASQNLLNDFGIDVEKWLIEQLSHSFAKKENEAFFDLNNFGESKKQPESIFAGFEKELKAQIDKGDVVDIPNVLYIQGKSAAKITLEHLLKLKSKLKTEYQQNATFLMHRETLDSIIGEKDSNGRFIWQPGIFLSTPDSLLGLPIVCSDNMPSIHEVQDQEQEKNVHKPLILLGDFKAAYKIVEHADLPLIRNPYTNQPYVSFFAKKRIGGKLLQKDALCAIISVLTNNKEPE